MVEPSFADYVSLLYTLFERFLQQQAAPPTRGCPSDLYEDKSLFKLKPWLVKICGQRCVLSQGLHML